MRGAVVIVFVHETWLHRSHYLTPVGCVSLRTANVGNSYSWRAYLGRSILERTGISLSKVVGGSVYPGIHDIICWFSTSRDKEARKCYKAKPNKQKNTKIIPGPSGWPNPFYRSRWPEKWNSGTRAQIGKLQRTLNIRLRGFIFFFRLVASEHFWSCNTLVGHFFFEHSLKWILIMSALIYNVHYTAFSRIELRQRPDNY